MAERNYEFRKRMMEVHRPNRRMPWVVKKENQVEITSDWCIYIADMDDKVIYNAARDLEDYLAVSMGVCVRFQIGGAFPSKAIVYGIDEGLDKNEYRFVVQEDRIIFLGVDSRATAQASFYAEDLMNLAEAPFLEMQNEKRHKLYSPRMVHSGYGLDMFPEEHLRTIAHAGIDALLIFVCDLDITPIGYQDFNDLIYRASLWGIDVYVYSRMLSEEYPEGEEGERFYESTYGKLFRNCPGFKGVFLVGESVEFPSKDPHTTGRLRKDNIDENGNRIIRGKKSPGWWPCCDFPIFLDMVKKIIRKYNPQADIIFCTYNWGYVDEENRLALIRNLPTDISLLVTYEAHEPVEREGRKHSIWDYTISFEGPGQYFVSEAKEAKKRGIPLYAITNTGGLTWDIGTIPYDPVPYQWMKRYETMRHAYENWGLCGTMDSHHYGFYPSFISDLSKQAFYAPTPNLDEALRNIAVRDFSEETADDVLEAWKCFSEGFYWMIPTDPDQYGPLRVGPSYPLVLFDWEKVVFPSPEHALHGRNEICYPEYRYPIGASGTSYRLTEDDIDRLRHEIRCDSKTIDYYEQGCSILEPLIERIHESKQEEAKRLLNLGRYIANCVRTTVNVKKWRLLKEDLQSEDKEVRHLTAIKMRELANEEIANARNTIPLVEFDSRLGYEPSMEYMGDKEHIEWKIDLTQKMLEDELKLYL